MISVCPPQISLSNAARHDVDDHRRCVAVKITSNQRSGDVCNWHQRCVLGTINQRPASSTRLLGRPQPQMYPPVALNQYTWVNRTHKHFIYIYFKAPWTFWNIFLTQLKAILQQHLKYRSNLIKMWQISGVDGQVINNQGYQSHWGCQSYLTRDTQGKWIKQREVSTPYKWNGYVVVVISSLRL